MMFSELYSAYYNAVARILKSACEHSISGRELREIVGREAFGESLLIIEPALRDEKWQLLRADGTTPIQGVPTMPLTLLQKRWLKAISLDPRIRLFSDDRFDDLDVTPLFRPEDFEVFDRYADGDPYEDERYIRHFRVILNAIRDHAPLMIEAVSQKGHANRMILTPVSLEYSEKDDKFRLVGYNDRWQMVNLARMTLCVRFEGKIPYPAEDPEKPPKKTVELELADERKSLERVLTHFAHFEKQAEKLDENRYRITVAYDGEDETEMLIRILSFGPMIRVTSPESFISMVKERLSRQRKGGKGPSSKEK